MLDEAKEGSRRLEGLEQAQEGRNGLKRLQQDPEDQSDVMAAKNKSGRSERG